MAGTAVRGHADSIISLILAAFLYAAVVVPGRRQRTLVTLSVFLWTSYLVQISVSAGDSNDLISPNLGYVTAVLAGLLGAWIFTCLSGTARSLVFCSSAQCAKDGLTFAAFVVNDITASLAITSAVFTLANDSEIAYFTFDEAGEIITAVVLFVAYPLVHRVAVKCREHKSGDHERLESDSDTDEKE